jgi:hypothetical protein
MPHLYWAFICGTPDYGKREFAGYVGEVQSGQTFTPPLPQVKFDSHCDRCGKDHTYTEKDLKLSPVATRIPNFRSLL